MMSQITRKEAQELFDVLKSCSSDEFFKHQLTKQLQMKLGFDKLIKRFQSVLGKFNVCGNFILEEKLGEGGMGTVYSAREIKPSDYVISVADFIREVEDFDQERFNDLERSLDAKVINEFAVKVCDSNQTELSRERFLHEAIFALEAEHPNIVKAISAGFKDDIPWYVMEKLYISLVNYSKFKVKDWKRYTKDPIKGRLKLIQSNISDAVRDAVSIANALDYMHSLGYIHRDIKPENIMYKGEDAILTDFGLMKIGRDLGKTFENAIIGTTSYMSPKILSGGASKADSKDDLYSLGVVLYELITGFLPYDTEFIDGNFKDKASEVLNKNPIFVNDRYGYEEYVISALPNNSEFAARSIRLDKTRRRKIDEDLQYIIMKAIHTSEDKRYQSMIEFNDDLIAWAKSSDGEISKKFKKVNSPRNRKQITKERKCTEWYKRKFSKSFFEKKKRLFTRIAASALIIGSVAVGLTKSDPAEEAYFEFKNNYDSTITLFDEGNYKEALLTLEELDNDIESVNYNQSRFNELDMDVDDLRNKSALKYVQSIYEEGLRMQRIGWAIRAEEKFRETISEANKLEDYKEILQLVVNDANKSIETIEQVLLEKQFVNKRRIESHIESSERIYLEEIVNDIKKVDANSKEFTSYVSDLLPRLIDFKVKNWLKLPRTMFPDYVKKDGSWNLCTGETDTDIGAIVKIMLMARDAAEDIKLKNKYYDAAKDWAHSMKDRWMVNNNSGFGIDYVDSYVKLLEIDPNNKEYEEVIVNAADALVDRVQYANLKQKTGEFIQGLFESGHKSQRRVVAAFTMRDSKLLYHAYGITNDKKYLYLLISNFNSVLKYLQREDGSLHSYAMLYLNVDEVQERFGSDFRFDKDSTRANTMATAIDGFTFVYEIFKQEKYLQAARKAADFSIDYFEKLNSWIPMWQINSKEGEKNYLDTLAGTYFVNAFRNLAKCEDDVKRRKKYLNASNQILKELIVKELSLDERLQGFIKDGCLNPLLEGATNNISLLGDKDFLTAVYDIWNSDEGRIEAPVESNKQVLAKVDKQGYLEEIVNDIKKVDANSKEFANFVSDLFPRLIDFKVKNWLSLPRDMFPDYMNTGVKAKKDGTWGKWNLYSGKTDTDIGAIVKIMLMARDAAEDIKLKNKYYDAAKDWAYSMRDRYEVNNTASFGIDYVDSFVRLLERDPNNKEYEGVIVNAADALVDRVQYADPKQKTGAFIQGQGSLESGSGDSRAVFAFPMRDSKLLYHAYEITKDKEYLNPLRSNFDMTLKYLQREDGSLHSYVILYSDTDNVYKKHGSDYRFDKNSTRANTMATAIDSFTFAYEKFKDKKYLQAARKAADFSIDYFEKRNSWIPMWQINSKEGEKNYLDTLAGTYFVNAFRNLAEHENDSERRKKYLNAGNQILKELIVKELSLDKKEQGFIKDGCLNPFSEHLTSRTFLRGDKDFLSAVYTIWKYNK